MNIQLVFETSSGCQIYSDGSIVNGRRSDILMAIYYEQHSSIPQDRIFADNLLSWMFNNGF